MKFFFQEPHENLVLYKNKKLGDVRLKTLYFKIFMFVTF